MAPADSTIKPPYMPLWVYDLNSDEDCMMMSDADFGRYMRLLMRQWVEGDIPSDENQLVKLCFLDRDSAPKVAQLLEQKFTLRNGDRCANSRCDEERSKAIAKLKAYRKNGKKGGRPKARHNQEETNGLSESKTGPLLNFTINDLDSSSEIDREIWIGDPLLNVIRNAYPKRKRGGPARDRQSINTACNAICPDDPSGQGHRVLLHAVQTYADSDAGRSDYALSLVRWMDDGCYAQDASEWDRTEGESKTDWADVIEGSKP